ncbi:MAG: magnesium transporter, partial [Lutibacter sp.]|nr:magnesium transporter [Lutibacter sp.]
MSFEMTKSYLQKIQQLIADGKDTPLLTSLKDVHYADVAEIIEELTTKESLYLIKLLDSDKTSDVIAELDEDTREKILKGLSSKEIAEEIDALDTDDAADIIAELPEAQKAAVISQLEDAEHAKEIVELLSYDEHTAGGLMAKELVKVNHNWNVLTCVKQMRIQAEAVTRVHSIYVVDDAEKLIGRLSLKDLLTTSTKTAIKDVFIRKVDSVNVHDDAVDVAKIMQKYDLEAIPVVDEMGRLMGRITIDDIVDVIKEEAEKDYQLAAGLVEDVEADDSVWTLTRARLPWLVLGLIGGLGSVFIMEGFEEALNSYKELFYFTPLIAAMAGNVGVQSSAIVVQGLANDIIKGSLLNRLLKEIGLSLINGLVLGMLIILFGSLMQLPLIFSFTVAVSMLAVIIIASL